MGEKITFTYEPPVPPKGFVYTGEFRIPNQEDLFTTLDGTFVCSKSSQVVDQSFYYQPAFILEIQEWLPHRGEEVYRLKIEGVYVSVECTTWHYSNSRTNDLIARGLVYPTSHAAEKAAKVMENALADHFNKVKELFV